MTLIGPIAIGAQADPGALLNSLLLASTEHAIIAIDLEGRVILWNDGARRLFGYRADETVGESVFHFWPENAVPSETIEEIVVLVSSGAVWDGSLTGTDARGERLSIRLTVTALRDSGTHTGFLVIARDKAAELEDLSQQVRTLLGAVVEDREALRRRVASEIHDDTIQVLTAVAMRLQLTRRGATDPEVSAICSVVGGEIESAIGRLRDLLLELHPTTRVSGDLRETLEVALEEAASLGGFAATLRGRPQARPDEPQLALIYRVVREALTNVARHADATRVKVVLADSAGGLLVQVRDNGVGFDYDTARDLAGHFGLEGMRDHAEGAGGSLRVRTAIGRGTTVELFVPCRQA